MATALQTAFHSEHTEELEPAEMVRVLVRGGLEPVNLAAQCGVTERTVYHWLSSNGFNPTKRHARMIRHLYDQFERGRR